MRFSLAISWASYAADFSRYLPADSSRAQVFGFSFAGIVSAYVFVQGIGIAGAPRAARIRPPRVCESVMGGGVLGALALLAIALAADRIERDERLQRIAGVADRRRPGATAHVRASS